VKVLDLLRISVNVVASILCQVVELLGVLIDRTVLSVFCAPARTGWSRSCIPVLRLSCEL
jgi:hypothetical protein